MTVNLNRVLVSFYSSIEFVNHSVFFKIGDRFLTEAYAFRAASP